MSERLVVCPKCRSTWVEIKVLHNPETLDWFCRATLRCTDCEHEWEGEVDSPWLERQREWGFIL